MNLSEQQISAILDAMPFEMSFVDENDRVQYWNKVGQRMIPINEEVRGRDLRECHKEKSLSKVEEILSELKSGERDEAWFWVSEAEPRILNRFVAIRDESGKYLGTLEYLLNFDAIEAIAADKAVEMQSDE